MRDTSPPDQQAFDEQVWSLVRQAPHGKVVTYGQVPAARPWHPTGAFNPILKMAGRMAALLFAAFLLTLCACSAIITSARLLDFFLPRRNVHKKLQIAAPLPG